MTYETLAQLLLLFLLFISCARIFFLRSAREDPLSVLPGVCFILSILNLCAFGMGIFSILILLLSFFVYIWNVRAFLRFREHLIVDHYSVLFIVISLLNLVLVLLTAATVIYFRPVRTDLKKMGVEKSRTYYTGNFKDGFLPKENKVSLNPLILYHYKKENSPQKSAEKNGQSIIFFVPSPCASVLHYEPLLSKLAQDGFEVFAGDFSSFDDLWINRIADFRLLKRFVFCYNRLFNKNQYETYTQNAPSHFTKELYALLETVTVKEEDRIYFLYDSPTNLAVIDEGQNIQCFNLQTLKAYKNKGWGLIEETEPLLSYLLCGQKNTSLYVSSAITGELEQEIRQKAQKEKK